MLMQIDIVRYYHAIARSSRTVNIDKFVHFVMKQPAYSRFEDVCTRIYRSAAINKNRLHRVRIWYLLFAFSC